MPSRKKGPIYKQNNNLNKSVLSINLKAINIQSNEKQLLEWEVADPGSRLDFTTHWQYGLGKNYLSYKVSIFSDCTVGYKDASCMSLGTKTPFFGSGEVFNSEMFVIGHLLPC